MGGVRSTYSNTDSTTCLGLVHAFDRSIRIDLRRVMVCR
jgi:hypothetical protein